MITPDDDKITCQKKMKRRKNTDINNVFTAKKTQTRPRRFPSTMVPFYIMICNQQEGQDHITDILSEEKLCGVDVDDDANHYFENNDD